MQNKLAAIADLTRGSKLNRILSNPLGYINLFVHKKIRYPLTKKGASKSCTTFFGTEMLVVLPAGIDLYLTGAKTHDSEIRLAQFLINNLKAGDSFLDIGAHFGYFSLLASSLVGSRGRVICVEASTEMFKILKQNTQAHANISINHLAASDKKGQIEFHEFPILYSEYNSMDIDQYKGSNWFKKNPAKKIKVNAIQIDSLLSEVDSIPKIVKIDVEGAEDKVISGMAKALGKGSIPFIAMEYIHDSKNKVHLAAAKLLEGFQYFPHFIEPDGNLRKIALNDLDSILEQNNRDSDNIIFKSNGLIEEQD